MPKEIRTTPAHRHVPVDGKPRVQGVWVMMLFEISGILQKLLKCELETQWQRSSLDVLGSPYCMQWSTDRCGYVGDSARLLPRGWIIDELLLVGQRFAHNGKQIGKKRGPEVNLFSVVTRFCYEHMYCFQSRYRQFIVRHGRGLSCIQAILIIPLPTAEERPTKFYFRMTH